MESYPVVWGVDIGHTSIKAVKLARGGDTVNVQGYSIEPIRSGEDVDRDEAVIAALTSIAEREDMMTVPVVVSLSGRQIFARTINIPVINKNKVAKMVELEARQQIPGDFSEVVWSYHLSPSLDGASYDVALFAARREIIHELITKAKEARINLVGISVTSLAVYNFVRYDQEFGMDETVIVLDVGAENTDLVVYKGDTLWIRNLGVSGNDITRAFMKKFRVSFEEAETLKCQVGESRQAEKIFRVIEGSLGELVSDVQRSLGFYKSQNEEAEFENVVVSGNTFKLPNLTQFMADRLGYAIITLVELERIKVDPELERGQFLEDLQSLGVCMGLALQGLGVAHADINLLPTTLRIQGILKTKRWAAIVLLVLMPIAFVVNYMIVSGRMEEYDTKTKDIKAAVAEAEKREQAAVKALRSLPAITKPVVAYRDYLMHRGVLAHVEASIVDMVEQIRREETEAVRTWQAEHDRLVKEGKQEEADALAGTGLLPPPLPVVEGGDAILYPVYLQELNIPYQKARIGADVFDPLGDRDPLTLMVRIPSGIWAPSTAPADRTVVNTPEIELRVIRGLNELTISPAMWRLVHPDREPPTPLPRLLAKVRGLRTVPGKNVEWFYMDPEKLTAEGQLAPEHERQKHCKVNANDHSYQFVLNTAWMGKGDR